MSTALFLAINGRQLYDPTEREDGEVTKYIRDQQLDHRIGRAVIVSSWDDLNNDSITLHISKADREGIFKISMHAKEDANLEKGKGSKDSTLKYFSKQFGNVGAGVAAKKVGRWYEIDVIIGESKLHRHSSYFNIRTINGTELHIVTSRLYAEAHADQTNRRQGDIAEHTHDTWSEASEVTFESTARNNQKAQREGSKRSKNLHASEILKSTLCPTMTRLRINEDEDEDEDEDEEPLTFPTKQINVALVIDSIKCTKCKKQR